MAGTVVQPEAADACPCGHSHQSHTHSGPATSLAQQLWFPWRLVVLNPLLSLAAFLVLNTAFITVGFILGVISDAITTPGLLLVFAVSLVLALRKVTSLLAYPGQLALVIRDGEANFARLTRRRLLMFVEAANELASVLGDKDATASKRLRFLQAHQNFLFSKETLLMPTLRSLELVEKDGNLGPNGALMLSVLREIVSFHSNVLSRACGELCEASSKDFEARRQQLFLAGSSLSSSSGEASPEKLMVPALLLRTQRLHEAVRLVGLPVTETKRDMAWVLRQFCQRKPKDVDVITNLDLMRADMSVRFKGEQVWITGHAGYQIDSMFLPAKSGVKADRPAVIICNPNGGLYEFHHLQMDWIKFYTDLDCHVLIYNYRGYGRNTGKPSPREHNLDGLAIVEYLKLQRGVKKVAVHGESIGGMVATYLASHSKDIDVLIADRTFANLPALAQRLVASWAGKAVNLLTRWETDNVSNYLRATCPKLLCSDPCDEIIHDGASLKSGVALRVELDELTFDIPSLTAGEGNGQEAKSLSGDLRSLVEPWLPVSVITSALWAGSHHVRRVSEADSRPQLGGPLTEEMTRRFSEAILSIAKRALQYTTKRDTSGSQKSKKSDTAAAGGARAITESEEAETVASSSHVSISVQSAHESQHDEDDEDAGISERQSILSGEAVNFPEELLAVVWMQVACMDGYCGQTLLQAAESGGHDKIRAWVASLLVWGSHVAPTRRNLYSLDPFERQGIAIIPVTIAQVHSMLQDLVEQHPATKFDFDIGFLVLMVEFLFDSLQRRWKSVDDARKHAAISAGAGGSAGDLVAASRQQRFEPPRIISSDDPQLGYVLPLHCGHNKNFHEREKQALVAFLQHVGFLTPADAQLQS